VCAELSQPGRIGHVGLAAGHVLHMPGIDQHDLEPGILKEVVERLPVVTGRLHHRTGDLLGDQMLTQGQDLIGGRAPRRDRLGRLAATSASNPDTDLGVLLGDIQASTPAMHHFHHCYLLPIDG
jgi:hypothetical protein